MNDLHQLTAAELRREIETIIHPEPDEDGSFYWAAPHRRLAAEYALDTSYFKGPMDRGGDRAFERLLENPNDPLFDTLQSISVPQSLLTAAIELFGQSLVAYHEEKRRHGWYRFYPPILTTVWAAFESWLRIHSEILVGTVPGLPAPIRDALLERKNTVDRNGKIAERADRRPVLDRYWLLLKYGCNLEYDRGSLIWQRAEKVAEFRDSLVHYDVAEAPTLTSTQTWTHLESVMLVFIGPSTVARRTLLHFQFDHFNALTALRPLISEFEERPLHKGWSKEPQIFSCPFDGVDEIKYPPAHPPRRGRGQKP